MGTFNQKDFEALRNRLLFHSLKDRQKRKNEVFARVAELMQGQPQEHVRRVCDAILSSKIPISHLTGLKQIRIDGSLPSCFLGQYLILQRTILLNPSSYNDSTVRHEIGHHFDLYHDHELPEQYQNEFEYFANYYESATNQNKNTEGLKRQFGKIPKLTDFKRIIRFARWQERRSPLL